MGETNNSDYLTIARIRKVWGRRGEVAAEILTEFPDRFQPGTQWLLAPAGGGPRQQLLLESVWFHKGLANLKFRGFDDISAAESLVGREIQIPLAERRPLLPGHVYLSDLVGCAILENGVTLGRVDSVEEMGSAAPLLRVLTKSSELLIPFAEEICWSVDVEQKQIHVRLPEGLKELNEGPQHGGKRAGNDD